MNERKNILIGKLGKTVKTKNIHIETGGGADLLLYATMAKMNPEYNFYFIGPNELNKCNEEEYNKLFPNHNVFTAWEPKCRKNDDYDIIINYFKDRNIVPDFALLFVGLVGSSNIPNFMKKPDGGYYKPLCCFKFYCAPYIYVLNKLNCPLYTLAEDARYITINAKDLANRERMIFSQINGEFETQYPHILNVDDLDKREITTHKAKYAHIEKIFLMSINPNWRNTIDLDKKIEDKKGNKIIILSNGCGTGKINRSGNNSSRLPEYKKYILDNFKGTKYENTIIYGIWDKEIYDEYPQIKNKLMLDLKDEIDVAKYTLVYSQAPGFVTCKPYEMITIGLLPFIHPEYDCYHLLDLPEYLYVKDEKDFLNKIDELENNPELYKKLFNECAATIKPEHIDGSFLINGIFGNIAKDLGFKYEKKPGVEPIFNRYSKDFMQ